MMTFEQAMKLAHEAGERVRKDKNAPKLNARVEDAWKGYVNRYVGGNYTVNDALSGMANGHVHAHRAFLRGLRGKKPGEPL